MVVMTSEPAHVGSLQCLVAGQYAQVSQDFHSLPKNLSASKVAHISNIEGHPALPQLPSSKPSVHVCALVLYTWHLDPKRHAAAKQREEALPSPTLKLFSKIIYSNINISVTFDFV